jgi:hypothetical protein
MKITEEQIKRVNQVINNMPIGVLPQAQEIVKILNESVQAEKEEQEDEI